MSSDTINVLITYRLQLLADDLVERIRDVSPRLNVTYSLSEEDDKYYLPTTDILYTIPLPESLDIAPRLKWIQLLSAGYEHIKNHPIAKTSITITNTSGIHGIPIAEFVLTSMVILSRNLHHALSSQDAGQLWQPFRFMGKELYGATVGIIGIGSIGREIARLAQAFGMRVIGIAPRASNPWDMPDRYLEASRRHTPLATNPQVEIRSPEALDWLLRESDFVVLAVPLSEETHRMIGTNELKTMKDTSFLVNPARGGLVDEIALIRALDEKWIAGAALDTFELEPLPADHRFYTMPNVLATPHMSGLTDRLFERCVAVFCENIKRFLDGKALLNKVHPRDVL